MSRKRHNRRKRNKPSTQEQSGTPDTVLVGGPHLHTHDANDHKNEPKNGRKEQGQMKNPLEFVKRWGAHLEESKNSNRVVAVLTMGIFLTGLIYAAVATMQWCVMRQTFIAANIPSVGVSMVEVHHLSFDENRRPILSETRTDKTISLGFIATIKNSGTVAAENFVATWKAFINAEEQPVLPSPNRPAKMLPGREIKLVGQTGQPATYLALMTGKDKLALEITVSYDDPEHKRLTYCEREEYDYTIDA